MHLLVSCSQGRVRSGLAPPLFNDCFLSPSPSPSPTPTPAALTGRSLARPLDGKTPTLGGGVECCLPFPACCPDPAGALHVLSAQRETKTPRSAIRAVRPLLLTRRGRPLPLPHLPPCGSGAVGPSKPLAGSAPGRCSRDALSDPARRSHSYWCLAPHPGAPSCTSRPWGSHQPRLGMSVPRWSWSPCSGLYPHS